jgi:TolA-binding protein
MVDPLKTIFTTDARLDDLTRARIWNALAPKLAAPVPDRRRHWPVVACASAAAVAALLAFALVRRPTTVEHAVPAGAALALPLGPATRAVVAGPGQIAVEREGTVTAVELRAGTLYGEFAGGGGRSLRIRAASSTIEVVGTLFSVSVEHDTACLAVAHGRVRMTSAAVTIVVEGGQRACAPRGAPPGAVTATESSDIAAMTRYQRTWLADATGTHSADPPVSLSARFMSPSGPSPTSVPAAPGTASPQNTATSTSSPRAAATSTSPTPTVATSPAALQTAPAMPTSGSRSGSASQASAKAEPAAAEHLDDAGDRGASESLPLDQDLYRAADAAIARGDGATAERALAALLAHVPQSPLADQARYERARLAFERRDWRAVRSHAAEVQQKSPLREPASYLGCRAAREISLADATECFDDYVAAFPRAPHAVDALAQLVDIAYEVGDCDGIATPLARLRAAFPEAPVLETWHRRCAP